MMMVVLRLHARLGFRWRMPFSSQRRGRVKALASRAGLRQPGLFRRQTVLVGRVDHREMMLCVADLTACDELSPRVSAKTSEVLPRLRILKTRMTFVSTSASEI